MRNKIILCVMSLLMLVTLFVISEPQFIEVDGELGMFIPIEEVENVQAMFFVNYNLSTTIQQYHFVLTDGKNSLLDLFNQTLKDEITFEQFQVEFQLFYANMSYADQILFSNMSSLGEYYNIASIYFDEIMTEYMGFTGE